MARGKKPTQAAYIDATLERVTLDRWRHIVDKAIEDATAGDAKARAWLAGYTVGNPPLVLQLRADELATLTDLLHLGGKLTSLPPGELLKSLLDEFKAIDAEQVAGNDPRNEGTYGAPDET